MLAALIRSLLSHLPRFAEEEPVRWMNVRWIRASNPPKTELRCYVGHGYAYAIISVAFSIDAGMFYAKLPT